jgi:hypothetical protein
VLIGGSLGGWLSALTASADPAVYEEIRGLLV